MKKILLVLCALFAWLIVQGAQAATYSYRNDVFAYDIPSGAASTVTWHAGTDGTWLGSPACTSYPNGDDDWSDVVFPGGFTFTFGGVSYSQVRVYSNGMLAFGTDVSGFHRDYTPQALPIAAAGTPGTSNGVPACTYSAIPVNLMIAYWNDIVAGSARGVTGDAVRYELLGTAPSRRMVFSWSNVALYSTTTTRYSFQIALYESPAGQNGNFRYQYTTGSTTGMGATVGVQLTTADYTQYAYNQAFIDPVAGTSVLWYPANQLATKGAEYRFDEGSWNGTAGEVKDISGSGQNAARVGAASNVINGKLCRGGSFTSNISNATIDAVATPVVPGNIGSIDFWFNSNVAWNSTAAMLLDATTVANRPFFLMKSATGALTFAVSDSAGTVLTATTATHNYALNTWHHVGVSWNLRVGTNQSVIQVFLDGATTPAVITRSTTSGAMPAFGTLYIGDNRTSGITPTGGTPNGANGLIDEVYVYPTEINSVQELADMNLTRLTCTTLDHFHIVHGGELVNCGSALANVTIEAHDVNHALFSLAGTSMTVSTSTAHGTWSAVSAINPVVNGSPGVATYTFSGESSVVLGLTNTFIESLNINVVSGTVTEHTGAAATCVASDYTSGMTCDGNLNFAQGGFRFVDNAAINNPIANQRAGVASGTYYLQAVKSDCVTPGACTGACVALFPSGTSTNIDLAFECINPTSCIGGQAVTFTPGAGAGAAGVIAGNNNGTITTASGNYTNTALTFNSAGANPTPAVPFTFSYSDVGRIKLWVRYPAGGSATAVSGSSAFVVAPHHFSFSAVTTPIKAGRPFMATITAMNGAATPAATPNFGKESAPENVTLALTKCQPVYTGPPPDKSNGTFTGSVATFTAGVANASNLVWSEVGNGDLTATLTSGSTNNCSILPSYDGYLCSNLTATGNTATGGTVCAAGIAGKVGPFVPDHFETTVTQGCSAGGYTYSVQPFTVKITAMNGLVVGGVPAYAPTINYDGSSNTSPNFAKAVTLSDGSAASVGGLSNPGIAFTGGIATTAPVYTFTNHSTTRQTVPTTITLRAADADASSSGFTEGTTTVRGGRVRLSNAHGSERLDLPVAMQAQYWNGAGWVTNTDDKCTGDTTLDPFNVAGVTLGAVTIPANTTCVLDTGSPGLSSAGCAAAGTASRRYKEGTTPAGVFAGDFNLWLKASGIAGAVKVTGNVPTWLKFDWDVTLPGLEYPTSRATFGVYKGSNEFIYMREMY